MPNVVHKTTLEFRRSVNGPDYPEPDWAHDPDLSQVLAEFGAASDVPLHYWKWDGTRPVPMTAQEKAAVDAALAQALEDAEFAKYDAKTADAALALVILDEFNLHAARITAILDAADNAISLADFKVRMALIADVPQRSAAQLKAAFRSKYQEINGG